MCAEQDVEGSIGKPTYAPNSSRITYHGDVGVDFDEVSCGNTPTENLV